MIPELRLNMVDYIGKYTSLKKVSAHEWAGPCPVCGGRDRFRVNDERGWFCRHCTGEKWGDLGDFTAFAFGWSLRETLQRFGLDRRATPAEIASLETARVEREAEQRKAEQEEQARVHTALTASQDWQTYAGHPEAIERWAARGIPATWVKYYGLGYCQNRRHAHDGQWFESDSLTIPYFRPVFTPHPDGGSDVTWRLIGLQHRLLIDNPPGGKFRPHLPGAGKHLFFTDVFQRSIIGDLLIVEGEAKAIATWAALWAGEDPLTPNLTVIGVAGKTWKAEWVEQFRQASRVWICLDPDATASARRLAVAIGEQARVVLLPEKIDDLISIGVIDGFRLIEILEASC